jgi:hypothetical protein
MIRPPPVVRERFGVDKRNAATASRYIREAVTAGMIGPEDPAASKKQMKYVPFWALTAHQSGGGA